MPRNENVHEQYRGWLRHYEERLEQWHNHQKAGDLFCALSESLPLYSVYSRTHTISVRMVERLNKRNGAFIEFASARKDIVMNLASLLILPIQRIPRYSLLLKDIIKDTPEEHPDYEDLCRGLEEVERLAKGMNRAAKMTNNTRKILDIENMFNGDLFLLKPEDARKYVQSADVEVIIGKKLHEDARLWLFSDVVVLGQLKDEFVEGEPEYNLLVRVDLININVEPVNDAKDSMSFSIKTIKNKNANDDVSVVVVCARDDERRMWLELITKSKGKLIDQLLSIA